MDISKQTTSGLDQLKDIYYQFVSEIDSNDPTLKLALFFIMFNPTFWNIAARLEYNTHIITKIAGGAKRGCYLLAATIFGLGIVRDYYFHKSLETQVTSDLLDYSLVKYLGAALFGSGQVLVLTSMYQLGITGTYLGDYFGILMDHIVTAFPFNVCANPMYQGSTLTFLGTSLYYGKPAGVFATLVVNLMYTLALKFEEPFTAKIYAKREEAKATKST